MSTKLYIMKFERDGDCFLKVGKSNNPERRLKVLSVNHKGTLIKQYDDINVDWGKIESKVHTKFRDNLYLSDILLTNSTESYPMELMDVITAHIDTLSKLPEFTFEYNSSKVIDYLEIYSKPKDLVLKPNKYKLEFILNNVVQTKLPNVPLIDKAILLGLLSFMSKDSCGLYSCEIKYKQLSYCMGVSITVIGRALALFEKDGYIASIKDINGNKTYIWLGVTEKERLYNSQGQSKVTTEEWENYFINRLTVEELTEKANEAQKLANRARSQYNKAMINQSLTN